MDFGDHTIHSDSEIGIKQPIEGKNLYCPECEKAECTSKLRVNLLSFSKAMYVCPKDTCTFPFNLGEEVRNYIFDVQDSSAASDVDDLDELLRYDDEWERECRRGFRTLKKCLSNPLAAQCETSGKTKTTEVEKGDESSARTNGRRSVRQRRRPSRFADYVIFDEISTTISSEDSEFIVSKPKRRPGPKENHLTVGELISSAWSKPATNAPGCSGNESQFAMNVPVIDVYHCPFYKRDIRPSSSLAKCQLPWITCGQVTQKYLWRKLRRRTRFCKRPNGTKPTVRFPFPWDSSPTKEAPEKRFIQKSIFAEVKEKLMNVCSSANKKQQEVVQRTDAEPEDSLLTLEDLDTIFPVDVEQNFVQLNEGIKGFNLFSEPNLDEFL